MYDGNNGASLPDSAIFFETTFVKKLTLCLNGNSLILNYMNVWVQLSLVHACVVGIFNTYTKLPFQFPCKKGGSQIHHVA